MLRSDATVGRLARSRAVQLTLIALVGAVLRFRGILHGLSDGLIYHADAHLAVWSAWHLHLGGSLRGARFGAAHGVLSWLAVEATDLVGRAAGYPPVWSFALIGSVLACLTAVMGTLTVPAVYVLGARAFDQRVGLLAAAFVAVSPLHAFHSHYPYRDVPMVLALTLTLTACVSLAARPSALAYAGAAVGAGLTIALKPAGLVVTVPIAVALALAWRRRRAPWVPLATLALLVVVLVEVSVFQTGHSLSPLAGARDRAAFAWGFVTRHGPTVWHGTTRALPLLGDWLGWPTLLAFGVGFGVAVWRRHLADLVLVAFLVPAFLAAAAIPWMDERFFVYLVPPAAVLLARALLGAAERRPGPAVRAGRRPRADADAAGRRPRPLGLAGGPPRPARHAGARRPVVRGPRPARDAGGDGGVLPARGQRVAWRALLRAAASADGGTSGRGRPRDELSRAQPVPRPPAAVSCGVRGLLPRPAAGGLPHADLRPGAARLRPPEHRRLRHAPAARGRGVGPVPAPALRPYLERRRGVSRSRPVRPGRPHGLPRRRRRSTM